jgi:hypothetical protein
MTEPETVQVECYSGHTYAQEPRALIWQGRRYTIASIESRWRTPEGPAFFVHVDSLDRFEVRYHEADDRWTLRAGSESPDQGREGARQEISRQVLAAQQTKDKEVQT